MPIYYVICEQRTVPSIFMNVFFVVKVVECDLGDIQHIWDRDLRPLIGDGRNIIAMVFYREPSNPFKKVEAEK